MTVCMGVRVEDPDIKNALSNRPPYNPLAEMSERVPPLMSADAPASVSSLIWVQGQFNRHIMAHDREEVGSDIISLSYCWKISLGHGKLLPQVQWVGDGSGCYPHSIDSDLPER